MEKKMPKHGDFCWNELMTPDANKAKQFYKSLFGWDFQSRDVNNHTYNMIRVEDREIYGGLMQTPADKVKQIPPRWLTYVNVDNVDDAVDKAQKLGAKITYPPTQIEDSGRFAIIQDPTGADIGLWQCLKTCG
ncbi:MAG: VOC family protein [Proteobacteria bacterium]|nr:VOC family protein [Pseudomonadota bacterium]